MIKGGAGLVAGLLCLMFASVGAAGNQLPRPPELEPAIAFWKQVYTRIDSDHGFLHDDRRLERIYAVVSLPPASDRTATLKQMRSALDRHRAALEALADRGGVPATAFEHDLLAHFPASVSAAELRAAASRLRVQRGLSDRFAEGYARSGQWRRYIDATLAEAGVPAALAALPHVESSFRPEAVSHVGAAGMWQFMPATGARFLRIDAMIDERYDPWASTRAAARLLAANYDALGDWALAITAYNHGVNGMRRAVATTGSHDIARIIDTYQGRAFGFASRNFYPSLLAAAEVDARADDYFPGVTRLSAVAPTTLEIPDYMPISALLGQSGVDADTLSRFNPALRPALWRGEKYLPRGFALQVPAARVGDYERALGNVPMSARFIAQRPDLEHRVAAGQTLSGIAGRYGVGVSELMAANGLTNRNLIRVGQRLRLPGAGAPPRSLADVAVAEGGARYRVRAGDTLLAIARRHQVEPGLLARENGIADPDRIRVGENLVIPRGAPGSAAIALSEEG